MGADETGLAHFRDNELLVASQRQHLDVVRTLLEEAGIGVEVEPHEILPGIRRLRLTGGGDVAAIVNKIRSDSDKAFDGFRPYLSPVHIGAVGQPNVIGNPSTGIPQPATNGLDPRSGKQGEGIVVAVIDTGIEPHKWLDGAYVAQPGDFEEQRTIEHDDGKVYLGDQAGHGVFLAGLILQQAPAATVRVIRTANPNGESDIDAVGEAICRAAAGGAAIINLSLGLFTRKDRPPFALEAALDAIDFAKTVVVASAGNRSKRNPFWPAAFRNVVAVGALAERDGTWRLAKYTNSGLWVDAYTPADDVLSTYITFKGETLVFDEETHELTPTPVDYGLWASWSGTSMAAATWSGAVARAATERGVSPVRAAQILLDDPGSLSFAKTIELPEDERFEYKQELPRLALAFEPAVEREPAAVRQSAG